MRGVGRALELCGFGFVLVEALGLKVGAGGAAASCLARDAAVGAVSRDGRLMGLVTSRGLVLAVGGDCFELVDTERSAFEARATEAAVGAVKELRLAFFVGCLVAGGEVTGFEAGGAADLVKDGVRGGLPMAGDFTLGAGALDADFVLSDGTLPFGVGFTSDCWPLLADFAVLWSSLVAAASPSGRPLTAVESAVP